MSKKEKIAFIGGGNMARSLIGGLVHGGHPAQLIRVCDPDEQQQTRLQQQFSVVTTSYMDKAIDNADCVVLAVKPQVLHSVCSQLAENLQNSSPLILSIAAGVRLESIGRWLQKEHALIRCMPNTPALIQAGATALFANIKTTETQRDLAESIMRAAGITLWVETEDLLDTVTALSGSGPAYVFLVIEAMQNAGEQLGLSPQQSKLLALQTVFGAAKMALEDNEPVSDLRERVTSKGGTTEQALSSFYSDGLPDIFLKAMTAARRRSEELAEQLDHIGES